MNDYDFSTLNDKEFEILASDLLSKHFNTKIDRFKPGPDQGIDGRFFANDGSEVILQYKHYFGSGTTKLL
ncbi:MAG: restriction endonuclease, partial [Desulfobacterales bacterium]|nr:restriction endonuclease [Desulfobacterales bacterium]